MSLMSICVKCHTAEEYTTLFEGISGKGIVKINKMGIEAYARGYTKELVMEPIRLAGDVIKEFDIDVNFFTCILNLVANVDDFNLRNQLITSTINLMNALNTMKYSNKQIS